jgi:hypothetical protein
MASAGMFGTSHIGRCVVSKLRTRFFAIQNQSRGNLWYGLIASEAIGHRPCGGALKTDDSERMTALHTEES